MPKTPYKLTVVITNWHWVLNFVCLESQQNNVFSCSIGIFHVLEFSHFPFPLNFLAYIHSLSLSISLSLFLSLSLLSLSERKIFQVKPPNATRKKFDWIYGMCNPFVEWLIFECVSEDFPLISHWFICFFLCFITIKFRCNYRNELNASECESSNRMFVIYYIKVVIFYWTDPRIWEGL